MERTVAAVMATALIVAFTASCAQDVNGTKPLLVDAMNRKTISATDHSFAVQPDGSLWVWTWDAPLASPGTLPTPRFGLPNRVSMVGDGTTASRREPIWIMYGVVSVSAGADYTMAIKADGSLWAWGANDYGQLGNGTDDQRQSYANPDPVKIMDDVAAVSAGLGHTAAIRADGSLWSWGWNSHGQLGDGTTMDRNEPVWIMADVSFVAVGLRHTMAIRADGSLWAWGWNYYGQLGDGTTTDRHEPVWIMDDVVAVDGLLHTIAIKADGALWAWGVNSSGQLGDGTYMERHSPVKVMDEVLMPGADIRQ